MWNNEDGCSRELRIKESGGLPWSRRLDAIEEARAFNNKAVAT
jgi:hypothetical protein